MGGNGQSSSILPGVCESVCVCNQVEDLSNISSDKGSGFGAGAPCVCVSLGVYRFALI